jgi:hypothetical protein
MTYLEEVKLDWSNAHWGLLYCQEVLARPETTPEARIKATAQLLSWREDCRNYALAYWWLRHQPAAAKVLLNLGEEHERDSHHCY